MSRILSLMAVAFILALGVVACTEEEEEGAAGPTATAARTATQAATMTTPELLTPSPTPQLTPDTAFGVPSTCRPNLEERADPAIIATGILSRQSQELLFDSEEFAALSDQLEQVLRLIRDAYPAAAPIHARDRYVAGQVILGVESPLKEAVQNAVASQPGTTGIVTGQAAFDALNAQLGGVRGLDTSLLEKYGDILLCLDEHVNVRAASAAYSELEGIRNAAPNQLGGDGPDIDALRDGDTWYIVFRDAWGDCPAGCMDEELMYFTVTGDTVIAVEASQAAADPNFASLVKLAGGPLAATPFTTPTAGAGPWGAIVGIGVYLQQNPVTDDIVVVSPLLDSSAYRAGIQAGDVILAVDGEPTSGWTESDATQRIGGPEGTVVTLSVRHSDGSVDEITIVRGTLAVPAPLRLERIGIELLAGTVTGVIVVVWPMANFPADQAGIRHGDVILAVDGESTTGWTVSEAVKRLDSFEGEHLTMRVRHDDGETEDIALSPISEFCPLALPATYMGVVFLNGDVAPVGSTITAVQGGVTWGTAITEDAGHYEMDVPEPVRLSPPCLPDGPLSFRIGDLWANESADRRPGLNELNLTFGSASTATP